MNFDWSKPMVIDWSGRSGPFISEDDIKNSVIKRVLRNQYYAPFCDRESIPEKPWWNPQDPFGRNIGNNQNASGTHRFVPGLRILPPYLQLSTLTKQQHRQVLRVLSAKYENVQPKNYPPPSQKDYEVFEEIKELYEKEQKEYQKWAKLLWINGACIRALRPKPTIERVYEAEFKMRTHEIQSLPQKYTLAAQIPLETKIDKFELEYNEDLINMNIEDLPAVEYPEEMESDFSILLKSCPVPSPCTEHPCKFVLPNEDSVSVLPLTEINRELAQYAIENGATLVASENALHCLLETERSWKLPVTVVDVKCPDYGDMKTVVVIGSEFGVQKECATQRTYKAYKHLLRHTFVPSTNHNTKLNTSSKQSTPPKQAISKPTVVEKPIAPDINFAPLFKDLAANSDENNEDKLLIDDETPNNKHKKLIQSPAITDKLHMDDQIESDDSFDERSSEPDLLMIDDVTENLDTSTSLNSYEPNCDTYYPRPSYSSNDGESDRMTINDAIETSLEPNNAIDDISHNNDDLDRLMIDDANETNLATNHNQDSYNSKCVSYKPNSEPNQLSIYEPNYSNDTSDSEPDNDINKSSNKLSCTKPDTSKPEPNTEPDQLTVYEPNYSNDTSDSESDNDINKSSNNSSELSYSKTKPNNDPDQLMIYESNYSHDTGGIKPDIANSKSINNLKEYNSSKPNSNKPETNSEPDQLTIYEPNYSNDTSDSEPDNDINKSINYNSSQLSYTKPDTSKPELNNEPNQLMIYEPNYSKDTSGIEPDNTNNKSRYNFSEYSSSNEPNQLMIYEPNYSNDTSGIEPENTNNKSRNNFSEYTSSKADSNKPETKNESDQLMISETNCSNDTSGIEPDNTNNKSRNNFSEYSSSEPDSNKPETNNEPDQLMIYEPNYSNDTSDSEPDNITNKSRNNFSEYSSSKPNSNKSETNNEPDQLMIYEPNYSNDTSDSEPDNITNKSRNNFSEYSSSKPNSNKSETNNEPDQLMICESNYSNDTSDSEPENYTKNSSNNINELSYSKLDSNKPETKNEPDQLMISETNCSNDTSGIEPDNTNNKSRNNFSEYSSSEPDSNKPETNNEPDQLVIYEPNYTNDTSNSEPENDTKKSSNNISELSYSKPDTSKPEPDHSVDVSEVSAKTPLTRLGISGMITRNRSINISNNITGVNKPIKSEHSTIIRPIFSMEQARQASLREAITNNVDIETTDKNKDTLEPLSLKPARKLSISATKANDNVNKCSTINTTKASPQLNLLKPCSIYVDPLNIAPCVRKLSFSLTNTNETTKITSEVKSPVKQFTRKRSISKIDTEVAIVKPIISSSNASTKLNTRNASKMGTNTDLAEVNEPTTEKTTEVDLNKNLLKPSIKSSFDTSPSKLNSRKQPICTSNREKKQNSRSCFETKALCKTNNNEKEPNPEPNTNKRARTLSNQINEEHDYCLFISENPKTTDAESRSQSTSAGVDVKSNGTPKSKPGKTMFRELFGDESDSDEPIYNAVNRSNNENNDTRMLDSARLEPERNNSYLVVNETTIKSNNKKISFNNKDKPSNSETSPIKPCLIIASVGKSPRNNKRKLSFNDPLTSDHELSTSFSEPDSEEAIAGFDNGIAVPCTVLAKDPKKKQKNTVNCKYSLRSRNKSKHTTAPKKIKTTEKNKENIGATNKASPKSNKQNNIVAKSYHRLRSDTNDSEDSDSSQCSRCISTKVNKKTSKRNKTEYVGLRRSRRISSFRGEEAEKVDGLQETKKRTAKINVQDNLVKTGGLRRSRRLSVRASINENIQSIITKPKSSNLSHSFSKITTNEKIRRKSFPADTFSKIDKISQAGHSRSLTNLNEITKISIKNSDSRKLSNSTPSNKDTKLSLQLSERTKRYLRRIFSLAGSDSDQSEDEMPERINKDNRSIPSVCTKTDRSDTELQKESKKYNSRSNSKSPKINNNSKTGTCLTDGIGNNAKLSERTKRHMRRSFVSPYSSCEETDQPNQVRKKNTRRPVAVDHTAINIDSSSRVETNHVTQSEMKTEPMDITEYGERRNDLSNNEMSQSTEPTANEIRIETIEIKIDLCEETNESTNNDAEIDKSVKLATEMDVSDSDTEFYDSRSNVFDIDHEIKKVDQTKSNDTKQTKLDQSQNKHQEFIQTEPDLTKTNPISQITSNEAVESTKNFISDSDSSDYFEIDETAELNIFHFTATNETDSEESEIEDSQTVTNSPNIADKNVLNSNAIDTENNLTIRQHDVGVMNQSKQLKHKVDKTNIISQTNDTQMLTEPGNTTERDRYKKQSSRLIESSENLNCRNTKLDGMTREAVNEIIGVYNCTCKGTPFEMPPPRSYKKLRVRNKSSNIGIDLIVHSSHKARKGDSEVLLEPIVEYQPELGGSKQPAGRLRALALSMMVRRSAQLINARVDYENGNVIVIDNVSNADFIEQHGDQRGDVADILHTAFDQLRFLMPGQYVLAHDSCHGSNAMLYTTKGVQAGAEQTLSLRQDNINMPDAEDALFAKIPPELAPVLLPYHKRRTILPLAFTPYPKQIRENKKTTAALLKAKHPPPITQWLKKKKKTRKPRRDRQTNARQSYD